MRQIIQPEGLEQAQKTPRGATLGVFFMLSFIELLSTFSITQSFLIVPRKGSKEPFLCTRGEFHRSPDFSEIRHLLGQHPIPL